MNATQYERCSIAILHRADELSDACRKGRLNVGVVEGLLASFADQPSFDVTWRDKLVRLAMKRFGVSVNAN